MFSFQMNKTQEIEKRLAAIDLAAIDLELSVTKPYQLRGALREEKKQLLKQLESDKGKQKVTTSPPVLYNPVDIYRGYGHEDRQSFRVSKEQMLRAQIKEKQQQIKQLCQEVKDMKCMIKCIQTERDRSSDEELSKHYDRAMMIESPKESPKSPSPDPKLSMLTGPKVFIKVQFQPEEYKPYTLDCMIDSSCQVNLAKSSALPAFYWEKTADRGSAIEGTPAALTAKAELFPVQFGKVKDKLTVYKLDSITEDCILGSEFLQRVDPFTVNSKDMTFTCYLNNQKVTLPISFNASHKCIAPEQKIVSKQNPAQLSKMEEWIR